jgi:hypothetical protein
MMTSIQKQVRIVLSPSLEQYSQIRAEFLAQSGSDDYYSNPNLFDKITKGIQKEWTLDNVTFGEAQCFAEPIRIANPDQCVSLYNDKTNSFIGNTSWNDQMEMFWEYPVYSIEGAEIKEARQMMAEEQGLCASWE